MIRNLIIVFLSIFSIQLLGSCKKFVQAPAPASFLIPSQVFADSAGATAAITGIYINMWDRGGTAAFANGGIDIYAGTSSDEMSGTSTSSFTTELNLNTISITNSYVATLWQTAYNYIYGANACIAGVTNDSALSLSVRNRVTGEAKLVRAFVHFNLVNLFGAVPLILSTDFNATAVQPRTSVDSVYAQVFADLLSADSLLANDPAPITNLRPNRYTVNALLARVSLYRGKWADAEAYATKAISGNYSLLPSLDAIFLTGSREAIWQIPAAYTGYETVVGTLTVPYAGSTYLQYLVTSRLLAAFETGDQRATHWVGSVLVGATTNHYPYKYKLQNDYSTNPPKEAYTLFRLAEQYLIRAEARAEQGDFADAIADLNAVRGRAGLGPSTASNQTDLLTAIMHERQVELCFEGGHRWFDLKRTTTIDAVLGAEKPTWKPYAALYPIPFNETQLNPFLTQNPGYN
jgi:hypothetical protein